MTPEQERQTIRDAMERLIRGEPIRSDGKLTVKSLAEEAGVKRWLLTHRHTDLQDEFRARIESAGTEPAPVRQLREQIAQLEDENKKLRMQLREAHDDIALLQRHIATDALAQVVERPATRARLAAVPSGE